MEPFETVSGFCRHGHFTSLSEVLTRSNSIALIWKCAACQFPRGLSPRFLRYHGLIWIAQIAANPYYRSVERSLPTFQRRKSNQSIQKQEKEESMRVYTNFGKLAMLATALLMMSFTLGFAKTNVDYKFKVHNNTTHDIKKILVSDDGKKWGYFDIGDGIKAGETDELVWDKSTDNGACEWIFKAVWSNDEESEPVKFDFCEKGLTLEFTK